LIDRGTIISGSETERARGLLTGKGSGFAVFRRRDRALKLRRTS
jgi:hypothetical protein